MIVSLKRLVAYNYLSKRYLINARSQIHLFQLFKIPMSNKGSKQIYQQVIESNQVSKTIDEIYLLFENLNNKANHTFLHYYLQGYEESMYTRQQISLIEGIPQSELFEREMNELIALLNQLKDSTKYPILSQAIILSPLQSNTYLSYQKLKSGLNLKNCSTTKCKT